MATPSPRSLEDWLYRPSAEESICKNSFHSVMAMAFGGVSPSMNPLWDESFASVKLAKLIKAQLVIPEGDVIYVRERDNLIPLGEAIGLLAYYMHVDSKTAREAANLLETNFQGYFPIAAGVVWRNGITVVFPEGREAHIDLATLASFPEPPGIPEYGRHHVTMEHVDVLYKFFDLINNAVGEPYFFEKTLLYPFNQRIREKSQVLVGAGGNGKSLFMNMVQRLYGDRAYTDAPQPNFKGHDAAVISYNFIGKRVVTFNDVGNPSAAFLEWQKRMITGNLEVKTPSGAWLSLPCKTNFMLETNHAPEILDLEAHRRRYVIRTFKSDFRIIDHMTSDELDVIGERGDISAGDLVTYLMGVKPDVSDWTTFTAPAQPVLEAEPVDY